MDDDVLILRSVQANQLLDTLCKRILEEVFDGLRHGVFVGDLVLHESFTDFGCQSKGRVC